jgi:ankyrin repeat protein
VRALVAKGASVNEPSGLLLSPLHMAAQGDHLELVRYLLGAGAAPLAPDEVGTTPAQLTKSEAIVQLIQQAAAAAVQPR